MASRTLPPPPERMAAILSAVAMNGLYLTDVLAAAGVAGSTWWRGRKGSVIRVETYEKIEAALGEMIAARASNRP